MDDIFGNYTTGIISLISSQVFMSLHDDLKPEKEKSYEIGLRGNLSDNIKYGVAAFYIRSRDKLINTDGRFKIENAGASESKGVEANIDFTLPHGLYASFDYTYQNAKFLDFDTDRASYDNNRVPLVPRHQLGAAIGWSTKRFGRFDGSVNYVDSKEINNENTIEIDHYTVVDIQYAYNYKAVEIALSIKNLFDYTYAEYGEENGGFYIPEPVVYPADGRSIYASLEYRF